MRRPEDQHVRAMRNLLAEARAENSRMVAAAIGGHLSRITKEVGAVEELDHASDVVRDASLDLLKALHRGKDVNRARSAALRSVEMLEAALPDPSSLTPLAPRGGQSRPASLGRPRAIRELAGRKLAGVLPPLWRS
ncbi:hypothetical protein [Enterovirga aerilata]|uniref:Uncharacterized protein n=1 Tax=Enterovirga aerilata TaxID=2730920 RepID=A0A849I9C1_9HYPH|nr:hypothetical protein [Enterovirga sp. DB1703]NNM72597.1 hypothetical protein [Enterovirga sp. DB1703]